MATATRNILLNSGAILCVPHQTKYNVYFDASNFGTHESISPAYHASEAKITAGFGGRFFVGSILTPAKGGPPTIGNGDGGTEKLPVINLKDEKSIEESSGVTDNQPATLEPHVKQSVNKRKSFVMPILAKKGWSIHDWATESSVDFHTASSYLKCRTNPYPSTRKKLADSLAVGVEELPQ